MIINILSSMFLAVICAGPILAIVAVFDDDEEEKK